MRTITKLPQGLTGISAMLDMEKEEVREWPYYKDVVSLFKDYNLRAVNKEKLIHSLEEISFKCKQDKLGYFSDALARATEHIRICY